MTLQLALQILFVLLIVAFHVLFVKIVRREAEKDAPEQDKWMYRETPMPLVFHLFILIVSFFCAFTVVGVIGLAL